MKLKKIILIVIACVAVLIALCAILKPDISLSVIKYHTEEHGDTVFSFYGSFGRVKKIKVVEGGEKLRSISLDIDADALKAEGISAVETCDVNADGSDDILILTHVDDEGDGHRRLFLRSGDDFEIVGDTDIVNYRMENGVLVSEDSRLKYLAKTVEEYTVPFERSVTREEYSYLDGYMTLIRRFSVSYYSESDIYCVGLFEYDSAVGDIVYTDEKWLSPEEYAENKHVFQEYFETELS